ncbi:polysaccharide pyruvyl transferase family protein [Methyloversatilis discipulorum]|uniref:polysaccharide pyruvyl transferase family protein n=1 Tax=Methyloversatilis discipulorum TaxID=1119528 RepID=UPI003F313AFF
MNFPAGKEVVVGLLWHSVASGNLGVVALTLSQLSILFQAARDADVTVRVKVFGWKLDGAMTAAPGFADVEYIPIDAKSLLVPGSELRKSLSRCNAVLDVGEGDSFSDIYGFKRLLFLCLSKRAATSRGAALVLSPQTLGPFASKVNERLARWSLADASRVFARDPMSLEWAMGALPHERVAEAIDMAFCLPFERQPKASGSTKRIGINVSALLYFGGYGGGNSLELSLDFKELIHRLVAWALTVPDAEVWLIPHVMSRDIPEEDDPTAAREVQQRYPGAKVAGPFAGPSEAKSFMSGLDFFMGGRMHACIGAFSSGVPTVPLAYSRKFNGLFRSLEYPVMADCRAMSIDEAFGVVVDAFARREQVSSQVAHGVELARRKLQPYRDALVELLRAAAR